METERNKQVNRHDRMWYLKKKKKTNSVRNLRDTEGVHVLCFSLCSSIDIWLFSSLEETPGFEVALVLCLKHMVCTLDFSKQSPKRCIC